jgi:hypothetical protein
MIYSIQTIPEETVLVRPEASPTSLPSSPQWREPEYGRSWSGNDIPQQLHVSKLPSKSLSLGPGQVAIVPVTFLPRYPCVDDCEGDDCEGGDGDGEGSNNDDDKTNENMDDYYSTTVTDGRSPPPLSSTAKLDLVDLVGKRVLKVIDNKRQYLRHTLDPTYRRRNNMNPNSLPRGDEQYDVSTTVVVDTSRGVVKLPISASSIRDNSYRIPDVIKFHHPSFTKNDDNCDISAEDDDELDDYDTTCDSITEAQKRTHTKKRGAPKLTSMDGIVILDTLHATDKHDHAEEKNYRASVLDTIKPERECFDLYLSNPFLDRELQVMEVLVSRPEFVSVQFDPERMAAPDLTMLVGSGPSQVVRQWTVDGPLYLPPESDNHYILSICTAFEGEIDPDEGSETYLDEMSKWIDSGDPTRNLGFLQIRTDAETLFIGLEHAENVPSLSLNTGAFSSGGLQTSRSNNHSSSLAPSGENSKSGTTSTLLKSFPDRLDFDMISTTSPAMHATFGLQNKSPVPIRIMRVTVGVDSAGDKENAREIELIGLKLTVGVKKSVGSAENDGDNDDDSNGQLDSLILGAATSLDDILELTCSLNPDRFFSDSNKEGFYFIGTVVIRGTMDTELSYNQWREETLRNPYRDEHLTVELPFAVSILNGRVEALIERSSHPYPQLFAAQSWDGSGRAVSHLFFPMNQYAAIEGTEDVLPQQMYLGANEIRHDLRILSNMVFPLNLVGAKIIDDDPHDKYSLCNRFNVSTSPPSNPDDLYFGFEEIGLLLLKYKFGTKGKRGEKHQEFFPRNIDPYLPKRCSMIVMTSPEEAGTFQIPLLIFPGRLEVSSADSSVVGSSEQSRALLGFGHLLSWCRSSRLGKSFIEALHNVSEDSRKPKSDSHLLSKYISDNSHWDPKSKPKYLPILLKIGAIDSGKLSKMNVYLTNHNPIPLTVSIDVGEVEGMSITLSRDASQATGDGNSLLDHLPTHPKGSLVKLGKHKDHPVAGLLDFLTSDEQALEFMSKFNFRDSLSPHDPAIKRSDVLQLLHDWHSEAFFHRDPVSSQSSSKYSSKCEEGVNPPVYSSFNNSRKEAKMEGLSGPLIFSSDKRLARPLTECWRRDPAEMSSDRIVIKIPPGARARFEVQVRAPPQEYLEDDISHILMSGLILSTNLGDVMPIFAIFEALQGQIHASHVQSTQLQDENGRHEFSSVEQAKRKIMNVPLEFTWNSHDDFNKQSDIDAIIIPPSNWTTPIRSMPNISYYLGDESSGYGVPLYLRSSFSRNVRLLKVDSCNPWFRFVPLESNQTPERLSNDGILVGFIRTNVDCSLNHSTDNVFPSFYQCMLNWLSNRLKLQPEGCGVESNLKLRQIDSVKRSIEVVLRRLKKSYKSFTSPDASSIDLAPFSWNESDFSHIKTGRRKNDGLIPDLALYDAIWKSLKIANKFGYNLLSSSLKATVEYDSETLMSNKEDLFNATLKQNLSLSIHDLDVQSVLKAPKLFDSDSDSDYLEFKPTIVGSVAYSFIAVRNPTGVPVRIRLGIAPSGPAGNSQSYSNIDDLHRSENMQNPYVQNGKSSVPTNESTSYSWWDGNGAFFIPNEQGDVIRSHNNISVTGGSGATSISLVNPSLNSQVGFLVGCGKRCGLGDKNHANIVLGNPMSCSPIGASAASGITLKGNIRYNSPELNDKIIAEPIILAGGTSVSIADGPAAFAIPFSALDEIVIPPFGKGQLGPIYFRPPGRHKTLGCDVAKQSGARLKGEKEILCKSQTFDSVLYLENSLTGIEEVGLRGKSVWNHLYFVDPPPKRGEDAFGDIEFRDGMPTLIFSGTSNTVVGSTTKHSLFGKTTQYLSVVKEVILLNGGDAASEIAAVSLFGMSIDREKQGSCSYGSFRLLNCWESMPSSKFFDVSDVNIQSGFVLKPGENRSLFVEHIPDCRIKKESVTLHVQLSHDNLNRASKPRRSRARGMENPFGKKETNMLLGYQMDVSSFSRCTPVDTRLTSSVIHTDLASMNHVNYTSRIELKSFDNDQEESPVLLFQIFLFSTAALLLCYALRARFHAILAMLQKMQGEPAKNVRNWNAAFRCLARSHPTSTELQTMSREQMRQDVIGRYKAKGNTPSSSLNSTNGFSRDRRVAISKTLRHRTGKEGSSGNERTRPFSDALFHDTSIADDSSLRIHFPIGLGWRTAYSRGIIKDNSLQLTSFSSRTKILLGKRAELAFENDKKNWNENNNQEAEKGEKIRCIEGNLTPSSSLSFSDDDNSNGTKNEVVESETAEIVRIISTSESEETKADMVEINHTNGDQWNERSKINQDRGTVPVATGVETVTSTEPKEFSSNQPTKAEKQNKWNGEPINQPSKNANNSEVLKRIQKPSKNAPKTTESEDSNKLDTFPNNAKWGQNQNQKIPAISALLGPLPKISSPNAWQGERQKPDTKPPAKKETIKTEKKSKGKDKSNKKKVAKQNTQGKKSVLNSTKQSEMVSVVSKDSGANITPAQSHPVLSPPPGFGAPQMNTPISPSANKHLHHVSTTDRQLSLDTMLQVDLSLGAPSQASSAQLPFPQSNVGGNDLLFAGTILESNPSPTMRGFNVAMTTENSSALASSAEQPWLPTLLPEDSEPVEQPWLPALLNEEAESGFDVMDFLDGILQDGSPTEAEPTLEIEPSAPDTPSSIVVGTAGNASSTPVAANPWAMESRAAAYGISFDDEDRKNAKDSTTELEEILKGSSMEKVLPGGLGDNIPLLTTAAILNAEGNNKIAEEDDDKAISFYAGLLDE